MPPKGHAMLGPSSAHRWLVCTPSARFEEQFPNTTSEAAEEGTLAHAIVETKLDRIINEQPRGEATDEQKASKYYCHAMETHTDAYVDFVLELLSTAQRISPDAMLCSEMRVDFSRWVPWGTGTTDTVIIADDTMFVIDLKYGKGHAVSAEGNPQLRLYALGAYEEWSVLYDIKRIAYYIVQPRLDSISSEEVTAEYLLNWADTVVKPQAELADAGLGEYNPGEDTCRWCKAKMRCRAYAERQLELMRLSCADPDQLSNEDIARIIPRAAELADWAAKVKDYAQSELLRGEKIPGFKLVRGRALRKISDEPITIRRLTDAGFDPCLFMKVKGIGDLEKLFGKKKLDELIGDLIIKPDGKPTLVTEDDPRPAVDTIDNMFKED